MSHPDPFILLSSARQSLFQDRTQAVAIGLKAIDAFQAEGLQDSISARNAVLRLGIVDLLEKLDQTGLKLSWSNFRNVWDREILSNILHADGTSFLDTMIDLGAPLEHTLLEVQMAAQRNRNTDLLIWCIDTHQSSGNQSLAMLLLMHAIRDCPEEKSAILADFAKDCLKSNSDQLAPILEISEDHIDEKCAAVCVLSELPTSTFRRLSEIEPLSSSMRDIFELGASRHGQIEARRREPDLANLIARPAGEPVMRPA